jgi:Flp pilus assembly protein TadG
LAQLIGRLARALGRDRRGSVYAFVGIAIVPMMACLGISIDAGRGYLVRARLSQALDAAALAGGRVFSSATRDADIRMYFAANFPATQYQATLTPNPAPSISADTAAGTLTLTATAQIPTTFMRVVGFNTLTVQSAATVTRQDRAMELALVMDNTYSMSQNSKMSSMQTAATTLLDILFGTSDTANLLNVAVVPFVTMVNVGSQYTSWIQPSVNHSVNITNVQRTNNSPLVTVTTQTAHGFQTGDFVTIAGVGTANYNLYTYIWTDTPPSLTSTRFYYRIQTNNNSINPATHPTSTGATATRMGAYPTGTTWNGCTEERVSPYESTSADAPPSTRLFNPYFWQSTHNLAYFDSTGNSFTIAGAWIRSNDWYSGHVNMGTTTGNNAYSPNIGCMVPQVLPLQPSRAAAQAVINSMQPIAYGGTETPVGLAWGWRVLSPNWRGLWGSPSNNTLPVNYDPTNTDKAIVFLTDGKNEWDSTGNSACSNGDQTQCWHPGINGNTGANNTQYYAEYTPYGRIEASRLGAADYSTTYTQLNNRVTALCNAMQQQNILIFTILLQENDANTQSVYSNCASQPSYYFLSPSAAELQGIFTQIGNELRRLHISR